MLQVCYISVQEQHYGGRLFFFAKHEKSPSFSATDTMGEILDKEKLSDTEKQSNFTQDAITL